MLRNGASPVPVPSRYRCRPGLRSFSTSVPVGLRLTITGSPGLRCCRREVSGPFGHLDREELQVLLPAGAGDGVGAHQRAPLDFQADHHELAAVEAEAGVARGAEAEKRCRSSAARRSRARLPLPPCRFVSSDCRIGIGVVAPEPAGSGPETGTRGMGGRAAVPCERRAAAAATAHKDTRLRLEFARSGGRMRGCRRCRIRPGTAPGRDLAVL